MTEETNQPASTESVGQEAAPAPQSAPDLNISDLLAVKNIIEVCKFIHVIWWCDYVK